MYTVRIEFFRNDTTRASVQSLISFRERVMNTAAVGFLRAIGRTPLAAELVGPTHHYTIDNALDYANKTVPNFLSYIQGQDVLDHGCGPGWQALAMVHRGAKSAHGVDIRDVWVRHGQQIADAHQLSDRVTYSTTIPRTFDVVTSFGAFEHYADPSAALKTMVDAVRRGGRIIISWAQPWFSPYGSHFSTFFRLPWLNLMFSEETILEARKSYKSDGATKYHEIAGGLNQMTVARYERLIAKSGCIIEVSHLFGVKKLPLVTRLPVVRELLTSACSCVLRKPE